MASTMHAAASSVAGSGLASAGGRESSGDCDDPGCHHLSHHLVKASTFAVDGSNRAWVAEDERIVRGAVFGRGGPGGLA